MNEHERLRSLQSQRIHQFTLGQRSAPTFPEYQAATGMLTQHEMELYYEQTDRTIFDPDVVAIVEGLYDDLPIDTQSDVLSLIGSLAVTQTCIQLALAMVNHQLGSEEAATVNVEFATELALIAATVDLFNNGATVNRTKDFVLNHCPPVYSPHALAAAYQRGGMAGARMVMDKITSMQQEVSSSENVGPVYTSLDGSVVYDSMNDLMDSLGQNPGDIVVGMLTISRHAQKEPLTVEQYEKLRKGLTLLRLNDITPDDFCEDGQQELAEIERLVAQYEENGGVV